MYGKTVLKRFAFREFPYFLGKYPIW